jgi:hypothetical protein
MPWGFGLFPDAWLIACRKAAAISRLELSDAYTALMIAKQFSQLYWKSGDFFRTCVECVPRRREMTIEPVRARMHIAMIVNRVI